MRSLVPWKRGSEVPVRRDDQGFGALPSRFERLFDDFFRGFGSLEPWSPLTPGSTALGMPSGEMWPAVDVVETEDLVRVTCELPGVEEKDVEVSLAGDHLVLKGEKRIEHMEEGEGWRRMERSHGRFQRAIPLPCEVEEEKVEARFARGVLTVELPKTQEARRRAKRIQVKSSN